MHCARFPVYHATLRVGFYDFYAVGNPSRSHIIWVLPFTYPFVIYYWWWLIKKKKRTAKREKVYKVYLIYCEESDNYLYYVKLIYYTRCNELGSRGRSVQLSAYIYNRKALGFIAAHEKPVEFLYRFQQLVWTHR